MSAKRNSIAYSFALLRQFATKNNPQISRVSSHVTSYPKLKVSDFRVLVSSYSSNTLDSKNNKCWNCGADAFLACGSCRSVQPLDSSLDYFSIFGLEKAYDITVDNLESKYKDWQKKLHPDLVHSKSQKEKEFAAAQSARVIDAYRTLSKPLSRALYLLQLDGINVDEEQTITDPDLLAEMMDLRESVEEASSSQALNQIESQIQSKIESWSNSFHEAYKKQNYDAAIAATQRMRYYERAVEEIVRKS